MDQNRWHVSQNDARLEFSRLSLAAHPLRPSSGLDDVCIGASPLDCLQLLQIQQPLLDADSGGAPAEFYVRAGDLVATYPESPNRALRAQIYWRAVCPPEAHIGAIEVVASMQTSLLDSCPRLTTRSELTASEALRLVDSQQASFAGFLPNATVVSNAAHSELADNSALPHCYLFRLACGRYSYAEMVHPADAQESEWEGWLAEGNLRLELRHQLFAERLEKGVILKARMLGIFLDRAGDQQAALAHYRWFLSQELPLTT